jgi:SAM-dependent methyltransferase
MRVLDVGCGVGEVARIVSDIVGETGQVVGIDVDPGALDYARRRLGRGNIEFKHSKLDDYAAEHLFDAVVGRVILMHVKDPVAALKRAAAQVRSGGVVCFIEPWLGTAMSHPRVESFQKFMEGAHTALGAAGVHLDMGARLYADFIAAGLSAPEIRGAADLGAGGNNPMLDRMLEGARSGIRAQVPEAQRETVLAQIEALGQAMRQEADSKNATLMEMLVIGAWSRKQN